MFQKVMEVKFSTCPDGQAMKNKIFKIYSSGHG